MDVRSWTLGSGTIHTRCNSAREESEGKENVKLERDRTLRGARFLDFFSALGGGLLGRRSRGQEGSPRFPCCGGGQCQTRTPPATARLSPSQSRSLSDRPKCGKPATPAPFGRCMNVPQLRLLACSPCTPKRPGQNEAPSPSKPHFSTTGGKKPAIRRGIRVACAQRQAPAGHEPMSPKGEVFPLVWPIV